MTPIFVLLLLPLVIKVLGQEDQPSGPTQPNTVSNCNKWYTVKSGDSCFTVETDFKISHKDFLKWNPDVSDDCITNFWVKNAYCVGVGSTTTSKPSSTSSKTSSTSGATATTSKAAATTTGSAAAATTSSVSSTYSIRNPSTSSNITTPTVDMSWPPKKTQTGQPTHCNRWYLVEGGDTCNTVYSKFGSSMTRKQLLEWNPSLGDNCSGLFFGWWICIGIQPQSSLTLTWATGGGEVTIPTYDPFTPIAFPTINSSFTATPTQAGLASDCQAFYKANADDTCTKVLEQYSYISREQFFAWNPALKGNCDGLWANYWYCIASFGSGEAPMPPTVTKAPSVVPKGTASDCVAWYLMTGSDSCESIASMFGTFSEADFKKWNPSVWSSCANIKEESWYCVAVPDTPKTRTGALPTRPPDVSSTAASSRASVNARGLGAVAMPTKI